MPQDSMSTTILSQRNCGLLGSRDLFVPAHKGMNAQDQRPHDELHLFYDQRRSGRAAPGYSYSWRALPAKWLPSLAHRPSCI
ncbi:hypothetical protein Plhal304r1_c035g0109571 [Plasmopara halstedii]